MPKQRAPRPTLAQVARAAGVSVGLASMCLTGAPGPAERTREHVREVARRLGYRPNKAASVLARHEVRRIGVVFSLRQAFHAQVIEALYQATASRGYELLLSAVTDDRAPQEAAEHLIDSRCQAIILVSTHPDDIDVSAAIDTVPIVIVGSNRSSAAISSVSVDGWAGVRQAMLYLQSAGHTRIAFADAPEASGTVDRRLGYESAMQAAGTNAHSTIVHGGETFQSGIQAAKRLQLLAQLPTAVVAHNDECAAGIIFGLKIRGLQVPEHVSVVGFDDSGFAWQSGLRMTTLHQDVAQIAALAVDEATRRIESAAGGVRPAEILVSPSLRIRDSSAPCSAKRLTA
ncbi:LacI family DNA-binding transcriptional regulator [Pseudoclavibacter sp. 13-3]|uniref:LacI family DNA-binding transcriptional regulator n=1 Tax=Pseudoclavibacter sp. 13-3 TaxID=2901228 RepID=UPI001E5A53CD|nr:LacI family DNA-binding transcriptional regulator [Pseudoclavibacter sp. 13-3]MCD7101102.1 LacI family transcriptional regulator [Pseudoclavibacter sp. 13-3]